MYRQGRLAANASVNHYTQHALKNTQFTVRMTYVATSHATNKCRTKKNVVPARVSFCDKYILTLCGACSSLDLLMGSPGPRI